MTSSELCDRPPDCTLLTMDCHDKGMANDSNMWGNLSEQKKADLKVIYESTLY